MKIEEDIFMTAAILSLQNLVPQNLCSDLYAGHLMSIMCDLGYYHVAVVNGHTKDIIFYFFKLNRKVPQENRL
jgi:hypothetical protein